MSISISIIFIFLLEGLAASLASKLHVINFKSPNLYPEGIAYDPSGQHFIVGSIRHRTIYAVSDAGVVETLISDPTLPPGSAIRGLAVDSINNRLLVVIHTFPPHPPFNALAAYDLRKRQRLFLSILADGGISNATYSSHNLFMSRPVANAVAVDFQGNAFVTNSLGNSNGNFIWKVNLQGEASIFSRSPIFTQYPINLNPYYSFSGLNGIAYVSKGYLLVVQSNTGKMFKVDAEDGTARTVLLNQDLLGADGIAIRRDGVVLVVSAKKLRFLMSDDSWSEGVVFDQTELDEERFPTAVTVGRDDRAYVIYGHVMEGILGEGEREWFAIAEVRSEKESKEENVWIFVLLGLGLAYFFFWRFQMKQLVTNMDKKTH